MLLKEFYFSAIAEPGLRDEISAVNSIGLLMQHRFRQKHYGEDISRVCIMVTLIKLRPLQKMVEANLDAIEWDATRVPSRMLTVYINPDVDQMRAANNIGDIAKILIAEIGKLERAWIPIAGAQFYDQSFFQDFRMFLRELSRLPDIWKRIGLGRFLADTSEQVNSEYGGFSDFFHAQNDFPKYTCELIDSEITELYRAISNKDTGAMAGLVRRANNFIHNWSVGHNKGVQTFASFPECVGALNFMSEYLWKACQQSSASELKEMDLEFQRLRAACKAAVKKSSLTKS